VPGIAAPETASAFTTPCGCSEPEPDLALRSAAEDRFDAEACGPLIFAALARPCWLRCLHQNLLGIGRNPFPPLSAVTIRAPALGEQAKGWVLQRSRDSAKRRQLQPSLRPMRLIYCPP